MSAATGTETKNLIGRAEAIASIIAEDVDEAERLRRLTDRTVQAIKEQGLTGVWIPESLGGLEASPPEAFQLFEAVAKIHGSAAWNLWIWSTGARLSASLSEEGVEEMFTNGPDGAIGAGGLFPLVPAIPVEGGYRVTGRWPYCSGSGHAQWLGGGAIILENGMPRMTGNGIPEIAFVTFKREDVEIIDTWHVVGLRATGSNDVAVQNGFVPEHLVSSFGPGRQLGKHFQGPLYRYPLMAILAAPIGIIATGIAQRAIDEFIELAETKTVRTSPVQAKISENQAIQNDVAKAYGAVQSARSWLYEEVDNAWQTTLRGDPVAIEQRRNIQIAGTNATRSASYAVGLVHGAAGGTSVYQTSPIERCFRDVHAATQHAGTSPRTLESAGKLLLGLPSDNPLLLQ
ncbi:MAG: hypothetical protein CL897_06125 [Dehalococcoidia bacterium]|nr:hypothetical protein [Dehalococcoidia bacterium]HCU99605.1 hypothetical protein [Dehalococcoidia bacterium]|tara:strand:+ start:11744 stop:12946 length:1203 start_codon:yes stop_codon:yes gene_type:complete